MSEEGLKQTANKMIFIGKPIEFDKDVFEKQLEKLEADVKSETGDVRATVKAIVPTYVPTEQ